MPKVIKIKRGLDINLKGKPEKRIVELPLAKTYALKPDDYKFVTPRVKAKQGERVRAGDVLFYDKYRPEIVFTSPVSGTVMDIRRGERRKILEYIIEADEEIDYLEFNTAGWENLSKGQIIDILLKSGLWTAIIQRPYGIIANPESQPKAVHISTFDSAPLAPDYQFTLKDYLDEFQLGVDVLKKISQAKIFLNLDGKIENNIFEQIKGVTITKFVGPHPAGNVGVQIHHLTPILKGEIVWTVNPQDVVFIGRLFKTGKLDLTKIIALTGSQVVEPQYYKVVGGTTIYDIVADQVKSSNVRYISGNVLTGTKVDKKGFLGRYDNQLTVIPEGNYYEFMAWAGLGLNKFSTSRTFFSWLFPKREWDIDTNLHGGERPFVITGRMDKVLPMQIYPEFLLKAILANDIEQMEALGIYEVIEEDFALCEFVCTSKINLQEIIKTGLQTMVKEMAG